MLSFAAMPVAAGGAPPKLKPSKLHVIPTPLGGANGTRTARPGDVILEAGLGFERTASLLASQRIKLAGIEFPLRSSDSLRSAVMADAKGQPNTGASFYCTGSIRLPQAVRSPAIAAKEKGPRFGYETRLCLIDNESDGQFDSGFAEGAKWPEDKGPFTIEPTRYLVHRFQQIDGSLLRVVYEKGEFLQGHLLSLKTDILDGEFQIASAYIGPRPSKAPYIHPQEGIKPGSLPRTLIYGDARITLLGFDEQSRSLTYRVDQEFEIKPIKIMIEQDGIYSGTLYTFE